MTNGDPHFSIIRWISFLTRLRWKLYSLDQQGHLNRKVRFKGSIPEYQCFSLSCFGAFTPRFQENQSFHIETFKAVVVPHKVGQGSNAGNE